MRLSRHKLNLTASAMALLVATSATPALAGGAPAGGLPVSGSVTTGNATIAASGTTLTINQSTANAVINWQSFNVGTGNKVVFVQPNAQSATLNRVTGQATSTIAGDILANGTVYLINPNGIEITSTGAVTVGRGFVASTLDIADADFLSGKGKFTGTGGTVDNAGTITTQTGGFVGLLGGNVANTGTILAPAGQVVIGAGVVATLDVNGDGFLQVALPSGASLSADGSAALVSGAAARNAVRNIVNLPASVNAQSASGTSGDIELGGTISVDATSGNAGHIKVLGNAVAGNASLTARALGTTGNGGLIETSGNTVNFNRLTINTTAVHGLTGTWLIDPLDLTIDAAGATALSNALATSAVVLTTTGANDSTGTSSSTGGATAVNPSAYGTVATGNGDITIASPISWSGSSSLTLNAYNNINISAAISAPLGTLVLTPGNGASYTGTVTATAAVNVGVFQLTNGTWLQNASTLPAFSATDFYFDIDNANFLRVAGGAGTSASPYVIMDAYGLQGVASQQYLTASFALGANIDASGATQWGGGAGFVPIGSDASNSLVTNKAGGTGFAGTFDGQGHTISGLVLNDGGNDQIGLFAYIGVGGLVENVGVTGVNVTANSYAGGLAGSNYGTISDSYATGTVTEAGNGFTGGLVGSNAGTISSGSFSSVKVIGTDMVGGLVGDNTASGKILNSYETGSVRQGGTVGAGGGLVGENYGSITDSYATGNVTGSSQVGGLVGYGLAGSSIAGSYATGSVFGSDASNGLVGGLVGQNGGSISNDAHGASYATGKVIGIIDVGGLVGEQDATGSITGAFATGAVISSTSTTTVSGPSSNIGGLVGANFGSVSQSYATGAVSGLNFVGGLVGANYGSISDTYATGSATSGGIKGLAQVGGLVGQNDAIPGATVVPTITNSYATGAVKSTFRGATAIGGLVGSSTGKITGSFYDTQTTGQSDTNGGTGVTTAQLQSLATFTAAGWAIDNAGGTTNTWRIYDGSTGPLLRTFLTPLTVGGTTTTLTYNAAAQFANYTVPTGANAAQILGTVTGGSASGTNVGTYTGTISGLYSTQQGYDLSFSPVTLKITPAALTVTANAQTITYGATTPTLTYSETGLLGSDTLTGSLTTTAAATPNAGTYAITQGTLSAGNNYTLSYTPANLTVNPAALTLTYTANSANFTFGTTPSGLSGITAATGLVNGDTLQSVFSGTAQWTTTATSASNVGKYAINGSGLQEIGSNYTVTAVQAPSNATALTISQAQLTVVTAGLTGTTTKTYDGTTSATLTSGNFLLSGFVNGEGATVNQTVGTYASANAGTGIAVTANLTTANFVANAGTNLSNYILPTSASGNIGVITKAPLTLTYTANAASSTYGTTPTGLSGTIALSGLVGTDTQASTLGGSATWSTTATAASNVGAYGITGSGLSLTSGNYTLTPVQAAGNATALTVNPASLTLTYTANSANFVFGTTPSGLSGTVAASGLANNDTVQSVFSGTAQWTTTATSSSNVGQYAINGSGLAEIGSNYTVTQVQAPTNATALTISPAPLTVVTAGLIGTTTKTYDGTTTATLNSGNFLLSGFVNGQGATVNQTVGTYASANVGTGIAVTASLNASNFVANAGTNLANYSLPTSASGNIGVISQAPVTLTYVAKAASSTYGSTPTGLTGSITETGLFGNDTVATVATGTPTWSTTATSASNVGSYPISGTGLTPITNGNYSVTIVSAPANAAALTVNPAPLTVTYTANPATSIYGTTPTGLSGAVAETGLVNGDTAANVVGGSATWSTTASGTTGVGSYAISGTGITSLSSNYTINPVQAATNASALTINPASLTVTANAQTSTYGAAIPTLTYSESGLVNGDTLSGTLSTTATSASNVGTYQIAQGTLSAGNNYRISYTGANLTINQANLLLTYVATAATSTYGTAPGALTGTISATGLVNGDSYTSSVTGTAAWATTATASSNAGKYGITGSGLTALTNGNYNVSFASAAGNATALTVNPATLTVTYTASKATSVYGTAASGLTGSVAETGLVNGDTLSAVVGGAATWSTPAVAKSNVGSYAINGTGITSLSSNYTVNAVQAAGNATALTVNPASLSVIAQSQTRTYGAANPTLTYTETGLISGDSLSGTLTTTATATSNVGSYAITQGTLTAGSNYTITYTPANLAVTPANLTLTYVATPASFVTGGTLPSLTGTISAVGLLNSDTVASLTSGSATWTTTATSQSNPGSYAIDGSGLQANTANYKVTFDQAASNATALTVTAAGSTEFGSNTLPVQTPAGGTQAGTAGTQALSGNNNVSQLNLDATPLGKCLPGSHCQTKP